MPDEPPDESLDELEPPFDEVFRLVPESSPLLRRELPSESPLDARCRRSDDFCSDLSAPESRSPDPSSDERWPDDLCPDRPDLSSPESCAPDDLSSDDRCPDRPDDASPESRPPDDASPDDLCPDRPDLSSPESRSPDDLCPDRPDDFPSDRDSSDRDSWAFNRWDFDCGADFVRCVSWPEAADRSPSREPEPVRSDLSDRSERLPESPAASRRAEAMSRTAPCPPTALITARARRTFEADDASPPLSSSDASSPELRKVEDSLPVRLPPEASPAFRSPPEGFALSRSPVL
ncbi:MAG TPA: hypothetical protein VFE39_03575 [Pseudonocardia sp.]|nr:hypothetical protein [Pseudonocardia sp.]